MAARRHETGKWFDTAEGVEWGDGPNIELRLKRSDEVALVAEMAIVARLQVEEHFTGEDEVPVPIVIVPTSGEHISFFDYAEWRNVD